MEYDITLDANGIITGKTPVSEVRYVFDAEGQQTGKQVLTPSGTVQDISCQTTDGNTTVSYTAGGVSVTARSHTDSFGRKTFDELQLGSGTLNRQFSYHAGQVTQEHIDHNKVKSTATTQLVSQITFSDGRTISYEYDAEERITRVVDSVDGTTVYTYDALGQLLTEKRNGAVVNTMTYDGYGNIFAYRKNSSIFL